MTRRPANSSTRIHVLEDDLSPGSFELLANLEGFGTPSTDDGGDGPGDGEDQDEFESETADADDEFGEDEFDDAEEELGEDFEEEDEFESDDELEDDDEDDDFEDEEGFDADEEDESLGGEGDGLDFHRGGRPHRGAPSGRPDLAGGGVGGAHP